jgi:hypothetical protein
LHSELKVIIASQQIDIGAIDPFVKAHGVSENDNNLIDQVRILLTDISIDFNCAIDLVHHTRKGTSVPGDADSSRGASSMIGAGRLMRTVIGMTRSRPKTFGITEDESRTLVRVDDSKVNLTPRSHKAMWFRMVGVSIGNASATYLNGDTVHTVECWVPADAFAKLNSATINCILNRIGVGPYENGKYSPSANARDRAAWPLVQEFCPNLTDKQSKEIIKTWIKNGVLFAKEHEDPKNRHKHAGLFVGKRPADTGRVDQKLRQSSFPTSAELAQNLRW